ncbi:MAG: ATP-binding cassette domain-containing protein [Bifidobacterium sp.]|uniref:ATP-binding cassette domain-containing protein n=2 Tax=Bifidobacterium TaxID=1678 RepID=A0AB39UP38_9BIFI
MNVIMDHVSVNYGSVKALSEFSASFKSGEVTVIVGGDGAGKSTLLRLLAGEITMGSGSVVGLPDSCGIGYQSADSGTWADLSVLGNMNFVGKIFGMDMRQRQRRIDYLLERANLQDARHRSARDLSGGMRQKLGCIMASLHEPDLLLLDEPTTGVDPISREELWHLIDDEAKLGRTVVVATTYVDEAMRGSSMILLNHGRSLAQGNPADVMAQVPGRLFCRPVRAGVKAAVKVDVQAPAQGAVQGAVQSAVQDSTGQTSPESSEPAKAMQTWRRGNTQFVWVPAENPIYPEGCQPARMDIENACIILLKSTGSGSDRFSLEPTKDARVRVSGTGAMRTELVRANSITKRFGRHAALSDVSIDVNAGEIVGLIGSNGAGKTTLMRVLLGLEVPDEGTATLFGEGPSLQSREGIGYVPQGLGLYPTLDAEQNLIFAHSIYSRVSELLPRGAVKRHGFRREGAIRRLGDRSHAVHEKRHDDSSARDPSPSAYGKALEFARSLGKTPVQRLALGTRRMLAYAIATAHDPELLILDEPTSGVDPVARMELWNQLHGSADNGAGVLITTHYMSEAVQCDRCVLLSQGKVVASGTVDDMIKDHENPYISSLFKNRT